MNERENQRGEPKEMTEATERSRSGLHPRIYAASLSDYNAGRLHGAWIDADQDAGAIHAEIQAMLKGSPEPGAEEWAIHDYEEFGGFRLSEWESIEHVAAVAEGIAEHGPAFGHWARRCREETASEEFTSELARFEEAFMGVWQTEEAFAQDMADDFGLEELLDKALPSSLRGYVSVDYGTLGRDMLLDLWTATDENGIWVFADSR